MKKIRICSLFSGIGGFETGILNAFGKENCEVVFSSEIDKYASKSYETIYGHAPHGDITKIEAIDIPDHDLLVGGFPCQAFSIAGHRKGFEDTRGTLFFDVARIAKEKKPKVMLLENVKGLLSHDKGKTISVIISTLSELGYRIDFEVLNSKNFGVPQNRERIFIVAVRDVNTTSWNIGDRDDVVAKAKKKLIKIPEITPFSFDFPKESKEISMLKDILETDVPDKYTLSDKTWQYLQRHAEKHKSKGNGFGYRIASLEGITSTISARYHKDGSEILVPRETGNPRRLTPLEAFRLQGFPDTYFKKLKENSISDLQMYRMAGNAVTTNVIKALSLKLIPLLD